MRFRYAAYRLAQQLAVSLPPAASVGLAEWLADMQWRRAAKDRRAVRSNLALILGRPPAEHAPIVREVFRNFGRYLVEFFTAHHAAAPDAAWEGYDHLDRTLRAHRGAIALTMHLGNWELAAAHLCRRGFRVSAVALPHADPWTDALFNRQRHRCGVNVIPLGPAAARRSLQTLREGGVLGLLGDRDFVGHGVATSLCGRMVVLPRGPATLSLRSQAPVVPTFLIREGPWKFRVCCEPPIWPPAPPFDEAAVQRLTQQYAGVFERYLKRFPDQWLMFQPITEAGR